MNSLTFKIFKTAFAHVAQLHLLWTSALTLCV